MSTTRRTLLGLGAGTAALTLAGRAHAQTFPDKPVSMLARTLAMVKARKAEKLPSVKNRSLEDLLVFEEENIVKCLKHAGERLGFDSVQVRKAAEKDEK